MKSYWRLVNRVCSEIRTAISLSFSVAGAARRNTDILILYLAAPTAHDSKTVE